MIRNIVFDVGKVLVSYEPDAYMDSLGLDAGAKARLNAAVFENPLWDASDQGLGTPEELLEQFILGDVELEDQIRYLYGTVGNTVELMPYALEWIRELKEQGYGVYILSNYSENMLNQTREKLLFLRLVDGVVVSYRIKLLKPDPGIYRYLYDAYSLNPRECVFLDDRPENIRGAQGTGMHGIVFRDYASAKRELLDFLRDSNI